VGAFLGQVFVDIEKVSGHGVTLAERTALALT